MTAPDSATPITVARACTVLPWALRAATRYLAEEEASMRDVAPDDRDVIRALARALRAGPPPTA